MNIGFFIESAGFDMAAHLVRSAKRFMPDVPIYQLTNDEAPQVPGAKAIRIGGAMPMGVRRVTHYTRLEGDWILVDSDVMFRRDVREVFDKPFDVALASREGTIWEEADIAKIMPYNFGVVFSRCPAYWEVVLERLKTRPLDQQAWMGEQAETCALADENRFNVEILPSAYNFTPKKETDDLSGVSVLHLKGPRKQWASRLAL